MDSDPTGSDPTGSDPTGSDPKCSDPTGSDPKCSDPTGSDPVDTPPTNAAVLDYLRHISLHFAFFKGKDAMDQSLSFHQFEFRTEVAGTLHIFEAQFENLAHFNVMVTSTEESLAKYPRGNALISLLYRQSFRDVEAFAVACLNAIGHNIKTFDLAGCIFVNGKCVDELIVVLQDMATEKKQIATEVKHLQDKMHILSQLVTMFCVNPEFHRS
jgi:hypothetical protein